MKRMLKNTFLGLLALAAAVMAAGCSNFTGADKTEKIVLPSYFEQEQAEATVQDFEAMVGEYLTDVYAEDGRIVLVLTEQQKEAYMDYNHERAVELAEIFCAQNSAYGLEISEDYAIVQFRYDEYYDSQPTAQGMAVVHHCYLNRGLLTDGEDWRVTLEHINCHTGNLIKSITLPDQLTLTITPEEWQASYVQDLQFPIEATGK